MSVHSNSVAPVDKDALRKEFFDLNRQKPEAVTEFLAKRRPREDCGSSFT
jgi:hypothetical protein